MSEGELKCRIVCRDLLEGALSDARDELMAPGVAAHLEQCPDCRLYAEGLRLAPVIFADAPYYGAALRQRSLAAVAGSRGFADLKLGLLLAPPAVVFLMASFFIPAYFLVQLLSPMFDSPLSTWLVSFAAVWSVGAAAGGLCLVMLMRRRVSGIRFAEAYHG